MEYLELFLELVPYVLSILATITAFKKGKKTLTKEEIEQIAEAKKQKQIAKLEKKNKITPSESVQVATETTGENITVL